MTANDKLPVSTDSVKNLLRENKSLSALQVGRIMFLNNCMLMDNGHRLYTSEQNREMLKKLKKTSKDTEDMIFYQRLVTYSINELNIIIMYDRLAERSIDFIKSQVKLARQGCKVDINKYYEATHDVRKATEFIASYAVFYDAMKIILKDRRLTDRFRIAPLSQRILNEAKELDRKILQDKKEQKEPFKMYLIGTRGYEMVIEHAEDKRINNLVTYLKNKFNAKRQINALDTEAVASDIRSGFYNLDALEALRRDISIESNKRGKNND